MSKNAIVQQPYVQVYNSHFNYRWQSYFSDLTLAADPSSVQPVWSQLHTAFGGTFVFKRSFYNQNLHLEIV